MAFDRKVPTDHERALEAVKSRPDIPKELVEAAWKVGPRWVLAVCASHPAPEQLERDAKQEQSRLRTREVRKVAARAREAKLCLDGELERMDDSTRRDVAILIGHLRADVEFLAWWSALDAQHEIARREDWRRVVALAESQVMVDLLFKTNSAIQSAIAESHVPKRKRRAAGGYTARSKQ